MNAAQSNLSEQVAKMRAALNAGGNEALEWVQFGEVNGIDVLGLLDKTEEVVAALGRVEEWATKGCQCDDCADYSQTVLQTLKGTS